MKILGIIWEHCSTATLMINGEIVACVSEERFTRKKNDESYPRHAIEQVLAQGGVKPEELDAVVFASERFDPHFPLFRKSTSFGVSERLREQRDYWYPRMYLKKNVRYMDIFKDKIDTNQYPGPAEWNKILDFIQQDHTPEEANLFYQDFRKRTLFTHLGIPAEKISFAHHHRCHATYAYYGSPFRGKDVLVMTADAWGDDMNASVSCSRQGRLERLTSATNFIVARLYRSMTLMLGMKPDEHEYKIMGLAAYAKPEYFQGPLKIFSDTMYVDGMRFAYRVTPPDLYVYFRDLLEGYRFDSIAGALQHYTEQILSQWTANCLSLTGAQRVVFGGGIAMNVKAMMEIAKLDSVKDLFVCPSPSDESLAMGACYAFMEDHCAMTGQNPDHVLKPLQNAYLGPRLDSSELNETVRQLSQKGCYHISTKDSLSRAAQLLANGMIVGRCSGRSEFGARALGNRSILADPRNLDVVRVINEKVKNRDFWMPFAASVLDNRADDYLMNPKKMSAPYMTTAFETTLQGRQSLRAGLHQADWTCRPQIVTEAANPGYHSLIRDFERVSGVGGLLNTSFNIHGEPIVQTAHDAADVLERSDLDALLLDEVLIEKKVARMGTETLRKTKSDLVPTH
jgi:carbamoyltransferase